MWHTLLGDCNSGGKTRNKNNNIKTACATAAGAAHFIDSATVLQVNAKQKQRPGNDIKISSSQEQEFSIERRATTRQQQRNSLQSIRHSPTMGNLISPRVSKCHQSNISRLLSSESSTSNNSSEDLFWSSFSKGGEGQTKLCGKKESSPPKTNDALYKSQNKILLLDRHRSDHELRHAIDALLQDHRRSEREVEEDETSDTTDKDHPRRVSSLRAGRRDSSSTISTYHDEIPLEMPVVISEFLAADIEGNTWTMTTTTDDSKISPQFVGTLEDSSLEGIPHGPAILMWPLSFFFVLPHESNTYPTNSLQEYVFSRTINSSREKDEEICPTGDASVSSSALSICVEDVFSQFEDESWPQHKVEGEPGVVRDHKVGREKGDEVVASNLSARNAHGVQQSQYSIRRKDCKTKNQCRLTAAATTPVLPTRGPSMAQGAEMIAKPPKRYECSILVGDMVPCKASEIVVKSSFERTRFEI